MITLYTTGCPRCKILEDKLKEFKVTYTTCTDVELMLSKGFENVPILEVDGVVMDFNKATEYIMSNEWRTKE